MKHTELWEMGPQGFFEQLSPRVKDRLKLSWLHMMQETNPVDNHTMAEIFSNAGQLNQGVVTICHTPPALLDIDVSKEVSPGELDDMTADEMAGVLISIYERHI